MTRGGSREGALASLAGAAVGALAFLVAWGGLAPTEISLAETGLAGVCAAVAAAGAGSVLGAWRPRALVSIAFGFGLLVDLAALGAARAGLTELFASSLFAPLLAFPVGAALVPLGLADPPSPAPPVRRPAWAERPLGPDLGRMGLPPRDETPLFAPRRAPSERTRSIAGATAAAFLVWLVLLIASVPLSIRLVDAWPGLSYNAPNLAQDAEFWEEGVPFAITLGFPGLFVAAALLAGDRPRRAPAQGAMIAVVHVACALALMGLVAATTQIAFLFIGGPLSALWTLVPITLRRLTRGPSAQSERIEATDDGSFLAIGTDPSPETEPFPITPERKGAIALSLAGAALGWFAVAFAIVPPVGRAFSGLVGVLQPGSSVAGDLEFWIVEGAILWIFVIPGLVVAAVRLAGDGPRYAFLRGLAITLAHAVVFELCLLAVGLTGEHGLMLLYVILSPLWMLVPLALGRAKNGRDAADAAP